MLLFTVENENNVSWQYGYIMEIFRTLCVSRVSPLFLLQILDFTDEKVVRKFRNLLVNMKLVSCSFCLWIRLVTISHFRYVFLLISSKKTQESILIWIKLFNKAPVLQSTEKFEFDWALQQNHVLFTPLYYLTVVVIVWFIDKYSTVCKGKTERGLYLVKIIDRRGIKTSLSPPQSC